MHVLTVYYQGDDDPMTIADLRAQELIIRGLWSVWPSLAIVGEEGTRCVICTLITVCHVGAWRCYGERSSSRFPDTPNLRPAEDPPLLDLIDLYGVPEELRSGKETSRWVHARRDLTPFPP